MLSVFEFTNIVDKKSSEFWQFWDKRNTEHPEDYPHKLSEEDWWEQYLAFIGQDW